jgi:arginase
MMIKVLGIPFDSNSSFLRGPYLAPPRIRLMATAGSANNYAEEGMEIISGQAYQDLGDLSFATQNAEKAYKQIKAAVVDAIADGSKLLSLGGDHSIAYPVLEAHAQKHGPIHVLQLDAHGDLYEDFEGNPYSHASPFARLSEKGLLKSLTQVGIRTLTQHQREQAAKYKVDIVEMKNFKMDFIAALEGPLYISLDIDVLDPAFAPGVSHYEPGGMSSRQLLDIIQAIKLPIIGADIVECNPIRDHHDMTAMVGFKLMKELIAKMSLR